MPREAGDVINEREANGDETVTVARQAYGCSITADSLATKSPDAGQTSMAETYIAGLSYNVPLETRAETQHSFPYVAQAMATMRSSGP